jgi:hypothetical protein
MRLARGRVYKRPQNKAHGTRGAGTIDRTADGQRCAPDGGATPPERRLSERSGKPRGPTAASPTQPQRLRAFRAPGGGPGRLDRKGRIE